MPKTNQEPQTTPPTLNQPHQAGDCTNFTGGRVSYLAPLPLPTGQPAEDYAHADEKLAELLYGMRAQFRAQRGRRKRS